MINDYFCCTKLYYIGSVETFVSENNFNFNQPLVGLFDFVLFPVYFILILAIAFLIKSRFKKSPINKFFIPGLIFKLIGATFITLVYNFYYKGGDTNAYFNDGSLLINLFIHDPEMGLKAFVVSDIKGATGELESYLRHFRFTAAKDTWMIAKISAIAQIFSLKTFLNTALLFGSFSYMGIWLLYKKFCELQPKFYKEFAICFLFLPSVITWGSGVLKDTITMCFLGVLFYFMYDLLAKRKFRFLSILIVLISAYILMIIKIYILGIFMISFVIYLAYEYNSAIKNRLIQVFTKPVYLTLSIILVLVAVNIVGKINSEYSINKIVETLIIYNEYLSSESRDIGSSYNIGTVDPSLNGIFLKSPMAIQFTFYRPFIWENSSPIVLLAALESTLFIFLTLIAFARNLFFKAIYLIFSKKLIFFCIIFSFVFAALVGVTSGNYGTLVRYKVPCMPFYLAAIFMLISPKKMVS